MKFQFTCTYCNKKWVKEYFYTPKNFEDIKCEVCKDENLIVKNLDKNKIDYYGKE